MKKILSGLTREELKQFCLSVNEKKYRGEQLFLWIHGRLVFNFSGMTDLPDYFREQLSKIAVITASSITEKHISQKDDVLKYLIRLRDNNFIESVIIRDSNRTTLCVSSQVGCALRCTFCATGKMGFIRNLSSGEIVEQVLLISKDINQPITNVVFMGMGEPFLNYDNVIKAIHIITDEKGLSIPPRRITVSTAGIIDGIKRYYEEEQKFKIAVSLNAPVQKKRLEIMPIAQHYPLDSLFHTLHNYRKKMKKKITFEYILIEGFNDTREDVRNLLQLTLQLPSKINVIPYNPVDTCKSQPSGEKVIDFIARLKEKHNSVHLRKSMGDDISAACGQLYIDSIQDTNERLTTHKLLRK